MEIRFNKMHQAAGAFVIFAVLVLIVGSFYVIRDKKIFTEMKAKYTYLDRADGISPATRVFFKGIEIGYVDKVSLGERGRIKVSMEIYPRYTKQLKGLVYVKVASGSIIGGKMVEIVSEGGAGELYTKRYIPSEDELEIRKMLKKGTIKSEAKDMNKKVMAILDDVEIVAKNIRKITTEIDQPESDVKLMLKNLRIITDNVAKLSRDMANKSPEMQKMVEDSQEALSQTNEMLKQAKQGSVYKMLTPEGQSPNSDKRMVKVDTRDL